MPLLPITAPRAPQAPLCLPTDLPRGTRRVVVMVHGYKYTPLMPAHCPHAKIFAPAAWPEGLGLGGPDVLALGFGWHARGRLRDVHGHALARGGQLATLIAGLRQAGRPVQLVAHSLGATLALAALPYLQAGDVDRILLLSGAAHRDMAQHALRSPAGLAAHCIQITSAQNAIFERLFTLAVPGAGGIGGGIGCANSTRVMIDCARSRARLAALGYPIAAPARTVCHWSSYTREGVMALNRALLSGALDPDSLPRAALAPPRQTRKSWPSTLRKAASHEPAH
ncbi:alpha/beta hydrolase [Sulfitobacter albidus]|uniref:Alpha/beta hydrolase n=1 Tax=Sulfitobacter albidus TaxID=2829501 RepID=A0A975JF43_9RHOB|nr:alpha/beta hydrolase [Sulfitobacter albidus]QUJ77172.1 alpha/beta hydrolase [Sulfitobacter albidus]